MDKSRIIVGAISGLGAKTIEETHGLVTRPEVCIENIIAWFLAGILGALGALIVNVAYKELIKKIRIQRNAEVVELSKKKK